MRRDSCRADDGAELLMPLQLQLRLLMKVQGASAVRRGR